jgi:ABC-type nitrate/sulfonate/bicarbonate transport system substrate-binding protein
MSDRAGCGGSLDLWPAARGAARKAQHFSAVALTALLATLAAGVSQTAHAEPLPVRLTIAPNPPTMTVLSIGVARAQKLFEKFDVAVEINYVDGSTTALRGLEAGQSDVGINAAVSQIPAVANGAQVKQFYGLTQAVAHQYLVPESIKSCEDLKGKAVAIDSSGGFVETLTRAFLATCGLTPKDVRYAANMLGVAGVQAMVNGQVFGMAYTPEASQLYIKRFADKKLHTIAEFAAIVPNEAGQGLGATTKTLAEKREALVRFTAALIAANAFINDKANKDRVVQIAQEFMKAADAAPIAIAYDTYLANKVFPGADENGLPKSRFDFTVKRMAEAGIFPAAKAPTYDQLVDSSIFPAADALAKSKAP